MPEGGYDPKYISAGLGQAISNERIHVLSTGAIPVSSIVVNVTGLIGGATTVVWNNIAAYGPCVVL